MNRIKTMTAAAGVAAAFLATALAPAAFAQGNRQKDKNNMRNIGIAAGALAGQQLLKGKGTNALILGAGAAYAGKKYEDQRKAQRRDENARRRYGYRSRNR